MKKEKILFDFFMSFLRKMRVQTILPDILASQCTILIYGIFKEYFDYIYTHILSIALFYSIVKYISDFSHFEDCPTSSYSRGQNFSLLFCLEIPMQVIHVIVTNLTRNKTCRKVCNN